MKNIKKIKNNNNKNIASGVSYMTNLTTPDTTLHPRCDIGSAVLFAANFKNPDKPISHPPM